MSATTTNTMERERSQKREDYLSWDEYFMAMAFLSAKRSKDPRTQVGACIVNPENKIVGIGYNGMPNGCDDDDMPWGKESDDLLQQKYFYVCHAEMNAVLNKNSADVKGCRIFVALFPCNECAKIIIQSGIKEVIYYSDKYADKMKFVASKRMFDHANIKYHQFQPKRKQIVIDFTSIEDTLDGKTTEHSNKENTNKVSTDKDNGHHTNVNNNNNDMVDKINCMNIHEAGDTKTVITLSGL